MDIDGLELQELRRKRKAACERIETEPGIERLWEAIVIFQGYPFKTAKGLSFSYRVKGREIFFDRKEKPVTKATVEIAYRKVIEMDGMVVGPKKLGCFGASYLYPVFIRLGVIKR